MNQNEQCRRSSRIRNKSTAVPPRSSSDSSSSSSAPQLQQQQQQPQLRKKNKRTFQDVTNTVARKRSSASSSSSADSARSFKKGRMTFKSPSQASTTAKNTVTPMTKSSTAFGDALPIASRSRSVPEGVLNLYPETRRYSCSCDENHCSSQSLSHCFLTQYGKEYSDSLKDWNALYFPASSKGTAIADKCDDHSSCSSDSTHTYDSSMPTAPSGGVQYVVHGSINDEESEVSTMSQQIEYQPHLTEKMRAVLVDWLIELSVEYKLHPRTLHLTVALLNRALECGKNGDLIIERDMFQCLGCTLMWMASKMEEITPPTVDDFVYISADSYSKKEITEMEVSVCDALQFRLWQVTSFDFVEEFLRAGSTTTRRNNNYCPVVASSLERSMVQYLLELSLIPNDLSSQPPRKICAAAVYLSRVVLGNNEWSATLQHYTGYTKWDLEDLVLTLYKYHAASEESKLENAYAKYSKEKYHQVALKTVPLEQDLGF